MTLKTHLEIKVEITIAERQDGQTYYSFVIVDKKTGKMLGYGKRDATSLHELTEALFEALPEAESLARA